MTKKEAIQEMRKGYKITHVHFSDNEWMTIKDGKLLLDEGTVVTLTPNELSRLKLYINENI